MGDAVNIVELGVAGLAVFLLYKISSNHLHDISTKFDKLTDAIYDLISHIKSR